MKYTKNVGDILGVLHDERASAVMCEHRDTESINVPDARFVNYWYFCDANYVNDTDENVIVFYLSQYYPVGAFATLADFEAATGLTFASDYAKVFKFDGTNYTACTTSDTWDSEPSAATDLNNIPLYFNIANM